MGNGCLCADENCRGEVREGFTEDMELEQDLQAGVELGKVQGRPEGVASKRSCAKRRL